MDNERGRGNCSRCGTVMYSLQNKRADVDGSYYCTRCAEELGKRYLTENVCFGCNRTMRSSDVKFVMPSSMLGTTALPTPKRLLCMDCYRRLATRSGNRVKSSANSVSRRRSNAPYRLLVEKVRL